MRATARSSRPEKPFATVRSSSTSAWRKAQRGQRQIASTASPHVEVAVAQPRQRHALPRGVVGVVVERGQKRLHAGVCTTRTMRRMARARKCRQVRQIEDRQRVAIVGSRIVWRPSVHHAVALAIDDKHHIVESRDVAWQSVRLVHQRFGELLGGQAPRPRTASAAARVRDAPGAARSARRLPGHRALVRAPTGSASLADAAWARARVPARPRAFDQRRVASITDAHGDSSGGHCVQPCHGPAACCQRDQACHAGFMPRDAARLRAASPPARTARRLATTEGRVSSARADQAQAAAACARPAPAARLDPRATAQASSPASNGCARAASTAAERRTLGSG